MAVSMFGFVVRWSGMRNRHISSSAFRVPSMKALMCSCLWKESLLTKPKTCPGIQNCHLVLWKPSRRRKCFRSGRNRGGILRVVLLVAKVKRSPLRAGLWLSHYTKTPFKLVDNRGQRICGFVCVFEFVGSRSSFWVRGYRSRSSRGFSSPVTGSTCSPSSSRVVTPRTCVSFSSPKTMVEWVLSPFISTSASPTSRWIILPSAVLNFLLPRGLMFRFWSCLRWMIVYMAPVSARSSISFSSFGVWMFRTLTFTFTYPIFSHYLKVLFNWLSSFGGGSGLSP